jgi:hypothetical protein
MFKRSLMHTTKREIAAIRESVSPVARRHLGFYPSTPSDDNRKNKGGDDNATRTQERKALFPDLSDQWQGTMAKTLNKLGSMNPAIKEAVNREIEHATEINPNMQPRKH